jgi:hypothetical protein
MTSVLRCKSMVHLREEAYVVAAVAGTMLGLSWLNPSWAHRDSTDSRLVALKRALKECAYLYVLVAILLIVAAAVETIAIQLARFG